MASLRDAKQRLEIIYKACVPEVNNETEKEGSSDEFHRLRVKIKGDIREIRQALKEREDEIKKQTAAQTAEMSYRIRLLIRNAKDTLQSMQQIVDKQSRKAFIFLILEKTKGSTKT